MTAISWLEFKGEAWPDIPRAALDFRDVKTALCYPQQVVIWGNGSYHRLALV